MSGGFTPSNSSEELCQRGKSAYAGILWRETVGLLARLSIERDDVRERHGSDSAQLPNWKSLDVALVPVDRDRVAPCNCPSNGLTAESESLNPVPNVAECAVSRNGFAGPIAGPMDACSSK